MVYLRLSFCLPYRPITQQCTSCSTFFPVDTQDFCSYPLTGNRDHWCNGNSIRSCQQYPCRAEYLAANEPNGANVEDIAVPCDKTVCMTCWFLYGSSNAGRGSSLLLQVIMDSSNMSTVAVTCCVRTKGSVRCLFLHDRSFWSGHCSWRASCARLMVCSLSSE